MTSQQLGDIALEEHRAVMAALIKNEINRPTEDQYEAQLRSVQEEMGKCVTSTCLLSSPLQGASQSDV
jgi:L-serine deaminase